MNAPDKAPEQESKLASKLPADGDHLAEQIVEAFSRRAKVVGIRSISMSELANELRTSTRTIYKYFRSKSELVHELVVRWESRLRQPVAYSGNDPLERVRYSVRLWVNNDAGYSAAFWHDLKCDYPELHEVYMNFLDNRLQAMKRLLGRYLKPSVNPDFAWASYVTLMRTFNQPTTFESIGMTREESLHAAFELWINGAIDRDRLYSDRKAVD